MIDPALANSARDRAARVRLDRAHVDVDAALAQARHDAVGAERHGFDRRRIGDDRKHDLGGFAPPRAACRAQRHAGGDQRLGLVARPVPAGDGVSGGHQPRHDQRAHRAEPDKSEIHDSLSTRHGRAMSRPSTPSSMQSCT